MRTPATNPLQASILFAVLADVGLTVNIMVATETAPTTAGWVGVAAISFSALLLGQWMFVGGVGDERRPMEVDTE